MVLAKGFVLKFLKLMEFVKLLLVNLHLMVGLCFFLVILIRPLADVFPDFGVLRTLVSMRREFGIFSGILILNHFFGFLVQANMPILASFKESWMWDYKGIYFWSDLCLSCWMRKFFVLCCDCRCFLGVVSVEN